MQSRQWHYPHLVTLGCGTIIFHYLRAFLLWIKNNLNKGPCLLFLMVEADSQPKPLQNTLQRSKWHDGTCRCKLKTFINRATPHYQFTCLVVLSKWMVWGTNPETPDTEKFTTLMSTCASILLFEINLLKIKPDLSHSHYWIAKPIS